jgi:hypothetical protein
MSGRDYSEVDPVYASAWLPSQPPHHLLLRILDEATAERVQRQHVSSAVQNNFHL